MDKYHILKSKTFYLFITSFLSLFLLLTISCHKKLDLDENTLFIVGKERISLEEFRNHYELDPTFPGYRKGEEGIQDYANKLVDKILCQKMAIQDKLFDQPEYQRRLKYEKQKASIQELYRSKISQNVDVTEEELYQTYQRISRVLHVKHLFVPDSLQAEILYERLCRGENFDSLSKKVFKDAPRESGSSDLGEIYWGDLDPSLENAAFQLKTGEFSTPVKSRWGFHILFLKGERLHTNVWERDVQASQQKIQKKLLARKERILADEYLQSYMKPLDVKVKAGAFKKISQILHLRDEVQLSPQLFSVVYLSDEKLKTLRDNLQFDGEQPFMTYRSGKWSLDDFLNRLDALPFHQRPRINSVRTFKEDIGVFIRNEFLYEDAKRIGLDHSRYVDSVVYAISKEIAYQHYLKNFYSEYDVPPEVLSFYQEKQILTLPSTVLPGMTTLESYRLYYASLELHNFLLNKFKNVPIKMNDSLIKREELQVEWEKPVRMFVTPWN